MTKNEVVFENTNIKTEITTWYAVTGASIIEAVVGSRGQTRKYSPMAVRFIFVDDGCTDVVINAYPVCLDGSLGSSPRAVPNINLQDRRNWPGWLHNLHQLAQSDVAIGRKILV